MMKQTKPKPPAHRKMIARKPVPAQTMLLQGDLTIYRAAEMREEIATQVLLGVRSFNLAGVTEFDSAGLQLLAATRASVASSGEHAVFLEPADCVRDLCDVCGLTPWLNATAGAL
jgi:anti-anti-sigma factor